MTGAGAAGSSLAPSSIQSRRNSKLLEFRESRSPPSWGTSPSGLGRSRLVSAAIRLIRRPPDLAAEGQEVLVGQVAAQAEAEAPLAGRRAVAGPRVAAGLAEGRDHVAAEADRRRLVHPLDLDRPCLTSIDPCRATIVAVPLPLGTTCPRAETVGDRGIEAGPGQDPGQVADRAVGIPARDDQSAAWPTADRSAADSPGRSRPRSASRSPPDLPHPRRPRLSSQLLETQDSKTTIIQQACGDRSHDDPLNSSSHPPRPRRQESRTGGPPACRFRFVAMQQEVSSGTGVKLFNNRVTMARP